MLRSLIFSCLLVKDGYGNIDPNLSSHIITDIGDWWDIMVPSLRKALYRNDLQLLVDKYAELVNLYVPDKECLPVDDPQNRFKLSIASQKWEIWANALIAHNLHKQHRAEIALNAGINGRVTE